jgi:hypothetical protein
MFKPHNAIPLSTGACAVHRSSDRTCSSKFSTMVQPNPILTNTCLKDATQASFRHLTSSEELQQSHNFIHGSNRQSSSPRKSSASSASGLGRPASFSMPCFHGRECLNQTDKAAHTSTRLYATAGVLQALASKQTPNCLAKFLHVESRQPMQAGSLLQ